MGIKDRAQDLLGRLQGTKDIDKKDDTAGHTVSSSSHSDDMKRGADKSEAEERTSKSRKMMDPTKSDLDNILPREGVTVQRADNIASSLSQMPPESKLHPTRRGISQTSFSHCLRSLPAELQMQILPNCLKKFCITIQPERRNAEAGANRPLGPTYTSNHWAPYAKIQAEHGLDMQLCRSLFYGGNYFTLDYGQSARDEYHYERLHDKSQNALGKEDHQEEVPATVDFRDWLSGVEDEAEGDGGERDEYVRRIRHMRFYLRLLRVLVEVVRVGDKGVKLVGTVNRKGDSSLGDLEVLKERFGRELERIGDRVAGQGGLEREQWEEVESLVTRLFHVPRWWEKTDDSE
ncbi:hypothetical protein CKM354_000153200 [Cercospora kikuchii]|uniref:Uncharacterized protein n=1 Tax=Cercospora kikuchii TaxID=84275 RepID=A0A9P3C885_9PEZI|nr:uncharacterized protein CKM354_000153200 [Cercospora kikuchii]GIZ38108.1 hypothetical protein CKM354_000153200 [Cercospora kikuchii]